MKPLYEVTIVVRSRPDYVFQITAPDIQQAIHKALKIRNVPMEDTTRVVAQRVQNNVKS